MKLNKDTTLTTLFPLEQDHQDEDYLNARIDTEREVRQRNSNICLMMCYTKIPEVGINFMPASPPSHME